MQHLVSIKKITNYLDLGLEVKLTHMVIILTVIHLIFPGRMELFGIMKLPHLIVMMKEHIVAFIFIQHIIGEYTLHIKQ